MRIMEHTIHHPPQLRPFWPAATAVALLVTQTSGASSAELHVSLSGKNLSPGQDPPVFYVDDIQLQP